MRSVIESVLVVHFACHVLLRDIAAGAIDLNVSSRQPRQCQIED
jgi:hypothetical protein